MCQSSIVTLPNCSSEMTLLDLVDFPDDEKNIMNIEASCERCLSLLDELGGGASSGFKDLLSGVQELEGPREEARRTCLAVAWR